MEVINDVRPGYGPEGLLADSETLRLGLSGGEALNLPTTTEAADAVHDFEQALARRPDSGVLRASYAAALAIAGVGASPEARAGLLGRARAEAERAIREHRDQAGSAYATLLALDQVASPHDWVSAEAELDATLKTAPQDAALYNQACAFLSSVGRGHDALYYCQHALTLRPHTPSFLVRYAIALDMENEDPARADQLLNEAARLYPDYLGVRAYRFMREAFAGSPDKALALVRDPASAPPISADDIAAVELLEKARKSGLPADAGAALNAVRAADASQPLDDFRVLFPMALGRLDAAFAASKDLARIVDDDEQQLMLAPEARLRRDPRFWPVAARAGLVHYWLTTNKWPDFCRDPSYPLDCRAEARRVAALLPRNP
jgi:hypothetical protein